MVRLICKVLEDNKIDYWLDEDDLPTGQQMDEVIPEAISSGGFFISVNTRGSERKDVSYMRRETAIAVRELTKRPTNQTWFIPLRFDRCQMPNNSIGGISTLRDLNWIDVEDRGWSGAMEKMLRDMGVSHPLVSTSAPLGSGLPSALDMTGGKITYTRTEPPGQLPKGLINTVTSGMVARNDENELVARFVLQSMTESLQKISEKMQMSELVAVSNEAELSRDRREPTRFSGNRAGTLNEATRLSLPQGGSAVVPAGASFSAKFQAQVSVNDDRLVGLFCADVAVRTQGRAQHSVQHGQIDVGVRPSDQTPLDRRPD